MKKTTYTQVDVLKRLPKKEGLYFCLMMGQPIISHFKEGFEQPVEFWLEEKKANKRTPPEGFCEEIIRIFNEITGRAIGMNDTRCKLISARFSDGHDIPQFQAVIDWKNRNWKDKPDMRQHIHPETLFSSKFDRYLDEARQDYKLNNGERPYSELSPEEKKLRDRKKFAETLYEQN